LAVLATDDEQELIRLEHDWMRAVQACDMRFLSDLLGEEFALTNGRPGAEIRGRQEGPAITRERYTVEAFEFESLDVRVYADAAMGRSRYRQKGRMDDQDLSQTFLMTDVFVRRSGRWLAVTRQISPLESQLQSPG
jgi:ketosteroid isomerase-like protein